MVTLKKQMRAFCLMCQRYISSINTAVKEQVCVFILVIYTPSFLIITGTLVGGYFPERVMFFPGLHHTMWSATDLQSPNNVVRPGAAGVSGLYARFFFAGRAAELHLGSCFHWSGWWQQQRRLESTLKSCVKPLHGSLKKEDMVVWFLVVTFCIFL